MKKEPSSIYESLASILLPDNGDTKVEQLTRAKYILPKSGEKWSESQKKRAGLLFGLKPRIKEAYSLVC